MSRRDLRGWSRRLNGLGTNTYFGTYSKNLEGVLEPQHRPEIWPRGSTKTTWQAD
jgi:hypothetical protein